MPQNLPLLECDLCDFSTKNHYIFKLHHKRCLRDHTEGLHGPPLPQYGPDGADSNDTQDYETQQTDTSDSFCDLSRNEISEEKMDKSSQEASSNMESKTRPTADTSPTVSAPSTELFTNLKPSRMKTPDQDLTPSSDLACDLPLTASSSTGSMGQSHLEGKEELDVDEGDFEDQPGPSSRGTCLPPPNVSRNYRCTQCAYATTKSKMFLYHQIDQHNARITVFPCNQCEYASRYKHKLARHTTYAHKVKVPMDDMNAENLAVGKGRSASAVILTRTQKSAGSIVKNKALKTLLGKLRGKGKVTDPRLATFYTALVSGVGQCTDVYKCKLCLYTGKSKNQMMRHVWACHVNGRVFRCNLCSYTTQSQIEFYAHKKKHSTTNATVFKCTECAYASDFKPNFERHMSSHGCDKPHK